MKIVNIAIVFLIHAFSINAQEYFVSPLGSNNNKGTIDAPFKDLQYTMERAIKSANDNSSIQIYLRGGSYFLDSSFIIKSDEISNKNIRINFSAWKAEKPIISGG